MLQKDETNGKYYFNGEEITAEMYSEILAIIQSKPVAPDGYDYRLKDDLTWELYKIEPQPEPDPDADEVLNIVLGVSE